MLSILTLLPPRPRNPLYTMYMILLYALLAPSTSKVMVSISGVSLFVSNITEKLSNIFRVGDIIWNKRVEYITVVS